MYRNQGVYNKMEVIIFIHDTILSLGIVSLYIIGLQK